MWELLSEYGVHDIRELYEAIRQLPPIPTGLFTERGGKK